MESKHFLLATVVLLFISSLTLADRTLDRAEVLQIFEQLTNQPKKTWIPAGKIEATHEEYRAPETTDVNEINSQIKEEIAEYQSKPDKRELTKNMQKMALDAIPFNVRYRLSNEYTMNSSVIVRFNSERFYWEINVDSRTDSVKQGKSLSDNFMTTEFNLEWNAKRIFAWDGEKYTTYYLPGNNANVDATDNTPHVVNGPLTAGLIPWGYGYYTYENLSNMDFYAVEKYIDGQTQIHLNLDNPDGTEMLFVMDPAKDYAVLSNVINNQSNKIVSRQYSNYQSVSGNLVPTTILIESYGIESNELLSRDLWNFTSIDANAPEDYSFEVDYETDALIEHFSPVADDSSMYRYSRRVDTDLLLASRLAFVVNEDVQPQNCATISLKYVASQLGKEVAEEELAQLANEPHQETNGYAMKQFLQSLGLYCRAVKTDIENLKLLDNCEVILHLPGKKHFVVLDSIDDQYIWTIDLAERNFYYRTDRNFFSMDWADGTALLVSDQPITGEFNDIDGELDSIIGGSGYQCNVLRQEYGHIYCTYIGGDCMGYYRQFYERWGCGVAASGSCSQSPMERFKMSPCIEHPYNPYNCTVTGEWTYYYMQACM